MLIPIILSGSLLVAMGKKKRRLKFKADPVFAVTKSKKKLKPSDLYKK
jgi:hypothetical protein